MVEGASHGLLDASCFELYGFPDSAPVLKTSPEDTQEVCAGFNHGCAWWVLEAWRLGRGSTLEVRPRL